MNYFRGIFKEKKKDGRGTSPSSDGHRRRHHHHDAAAPGTKQGEGRPPHFEEIPAERLPKKEQGNPPPSAPEKVASPPPPAKSSCAEDKAPSHQESPPQPPKTPQPAQTPQPPAPQQARLQPAYRYTGGEFSETISREEESLARQYNFGVSAERVVAEATTSSTRRNGGERKSGEFDSIFNQFMHGTLDE